ncbi:unnamed protein product [Toxocara canis]|uniref:Phospholipase D3 n=1 Tax=Toxocara canis TaxID=6265 RepID=A0A183VE52_TOXCA|nr:unnamed protein product [Toxocara canis]
MNHMLFSGILHTKAWLVDDKHLYIGSANIDWRALTQVKELGIAVFNCPCLANDASKLFDVYWQMGAPNTQVPSSWPADLSTIYNANNPMDVLLNTEQSAVYLTSAPPEFCPAGREHEIDAILRVIRTARQFIHISVMDYIPALLYSENNHYWPVIDDELRAAAYNHIHVKLMMSRWKNTRKQLYSFLRSLADINAGLPCISVFNPNTGRKQCLANSTGSVEVRIFEVPAFGNQSQIPYSRVNHNKYMVTDNSAYIAGVGVVIQSDNSMQVSQIVNDVNEKIFMRDWNSQYASSIYDFDLDGNRLPPTAQTVIS